MLHFDVCCVIEVLRVRFEMMEFLLLAGSLFAASAHKTRDNNHCGGNTNKS